MKSNACRNTRREIDELEIGQDPGEQSLAHLAVCRDCLEFKSERAQLRDLVGSLGRVTAPANFEMQLRARMAAEHRTEARQPFFARLIGTPALATAAVAVLAVGAVVWVAQRTDDRSTTVATNGAPSQSPNQIPVAISDDHTTANANDDAIGKDSGDELVADNISRPVRPRNRAVRANSSAADFSVQPASAISQGDPNQAFVNAPSKTVEVSLENDQGNTRKISLPPVTFGAQTLVNNNRVPVTYSANSRIW